MTDTCSKCGTELNDENWLTSRRKHGMYICKECSNKLTSAWNKANPEKVRAKWTRANRKRGRRPFDENRDCALYLGIHVAERVLSHVFNDVKRMPMHNPGYDIICNRDKKIDIKSACLSFTVVGGTRYPQWAFHIHRNTIADYFLCLAFDNREDLNPQHAWLIPGSKINHLVNASTSPSTISKWDAYRLDTSKIATCCDTMRTAEAVSA